MFFLYYTCIFNLYNLLTSVSSTCLSSWPEPTAQVSFSGRYHSIACCCRRPYRRFRHHCKLSTEKLNQFQINLTQNILGQLQNHRANFNQTKHKASMGHCRTTKRISTKLSTKHPWTTAEPQSEFQPNLAQSIQGSLWNHRANFNQT